MGLASKSVGTSVRTRKLALTGGAVLMVTGLISATWIYFRELTAISEEITVLLFNLVWLSIPFLMCVFTDRYFIVAWSTALVGTLLFWAAYVTSGMIAEPAEGANIGMGILMLLSPIIISIACIISTRAARLLNKRRIRTLQE